MQQNDLCSSIIQFILLFCNILSFDTKTNIVFYKYSAEYSFVDIFEAICILALEQFSSLIPYCLLLLQLFVISQPERLIFDTSSSVSQSGQANVDILFADTA